MEVVDFEYTNEWPITFSNEFFNFLNTSINGKRIFFKHENCILPVILKKKHTFKIGYFIHPPLKNGKKLTQIEEVIFFNSLLIYLKSKKIVDFIIPPIHTENFQHIPKNSIGYELGIIKLTIKNLTEETVFTSFKSIYRNLIRKAIKDNVSVKFGMEYFDDFYALYQQKLILENAPYDSYELIKEIALNLNNSRNVICGVAYVGNKPDSAVLNFNDNKNAYYMWAGTSNNSHPGSLRLLHWEIIQIYLKKGIEYYRMGGARKGDFSNEKHTRLLNFKRGFGSDVETGFHFTFIINLLKYRMYKMLVFLKTKLNK
jgi:lipid II:glycine glycyltransferase (peptidoglycan interpeptide bridge formation enzyme)